MNPVDIDLPAATRWEARNSPTRRVPSHGTNLFGTALATDLVPVDARGRSAPITWRTLLATEPAEAFVGFGLGLVAPVAGTVVRVHDGEPDRAATRSPVAHVPFALGQAGRVRAGIEAVAGNHVVLAVGEGGPFLLIAHLQRGSTRVVEGQRVDRGEPLGACGNSGNSVQPHVHLQATDSLDWPAARPVALRLRAYRRVSDGVVVASALPDEGEVIEPA